MPANVARPAGRAGIVEIGPDAGALKPPDTASILFDLGLGGEYTELLVRTAAPAAITALRAAAAAPDDPSVDLTTVLADRQCTGSSAPPVAASR